MKRIVEWVNAFLSRREESVEVDKPSEPLSVEDLQMPDIYAEVPSTTELLDLSSPDSDKKRGFNPYDTARLNRK